VAKLPRKKRFAGLYSRFRACFWLLSILPLSNVAAGDDLQTLLATNMCPGCQLSGAELTGKDLSGANLAGANLSEAVLTGANLSGANLAGAQLRKANLTGANLSSANCAGAMLKEASLIGAQAVKTNFAGADLSQANLSGVGLTEVSLVSAMLSGVNLSGATLHQADFTSADLKEAKTDGITFDSATKASLANANNIPEGLATRISDTGPKAKEKKAEVAAGVVTESEPDKTKSEPAMTLGGLFTLPSNPSQYYHNARMHAQRGEIDLALATYEKLMTFKFAFADPAYDLPILVTRLYGKAGAKTYLEKKIKPIAPKHLYLLAQQVLSDAPLDAVGDEIIAEQIDYPPLLVEWAIKTQSLIFTRDWSADNRPSVLAMLKIGHEFERLHGSGEYLRYFLDPIKTQSRTARFRQVYQVQVNQITSQAKRCMDVKSGKRSIWIPDWPEDCKRNDEDLVAVGPRIDEDPASPALTSDEITGAEQSTSDKKRADFTSADLKDVWCFAPNEPKKIGYYKKLVCDHVGGQSFSSEVQARAELKRLKEIATASTVDGKKVWCAMEDYVFQTTLSYCQYQNAKDFVTKAQAISEQNRLKRASKEVAIESRQQPTDKASDPIQQILALQNRRGGGEEQEKLMKEVLERQKNKKKKRTGMRGKAPSQEALDNLAKLIETRSCVGCNLQDIAPDTTAVRNWKEVDLTDADLSGANLGYVLFIRGIARNTKFVDAFLSSGMCGGKDFAGADFSGATLEGCNFAEADLEGVTATGWKIDATTEKSLRRAKNVSPSIREAIAEALQGLSLDELTKRLTDGLPCPGCDLRKVDFSEAVDESKCTTIGNEKLCLRIHMSGRNFEGANFAGADLSSGTLIFSQGSFAGANFRGANLDGQDLSNADVTGADFEGASLKGAKIGTAENINLKNTNLEGAVIYGLKNSTVDGANLEMVEAIKSELSGMSLKEWDLSGMTLESVKFSDVDLSGANLEGADLSRADLGQINLAGANLKSAKLEYAKLQRADLNGVDFAGANLERADLTGATMNDTLLNGAQLSFINLSETELSGLDFSGTNLEHSRFDKAVLQNLDFSKANLAAASLTNSELTEVIFTEANLKSVDFSGTKMQSLDLSNLDLRDTKFVNTDLAYSNLSGANLYEATIKDSNFSHANLATADMGNVLIEGTDFDSALFEETNFRWYDEDRWENAYDRLLGERLGSGMSEEEAKQSITAKQVAEKISISVYPQWQNPQLTNVDLSGRDLSNWKLLNPDFSGSSLVRTNFEQAILDGAIFQGADVSGSTFKEASIRGGSFVGATLNKKTRFPKTDLTDVSFLESKAKYVKFDKATLCRTILPDGKQDDWGCPENVGKIRRTGDPESNKKKLVQTGACPRCNLAGVDLSGVALECPDLTEADLTGANLSGVKFGRPQEQDSITKAWYYTPGKCANFTRALLNESNFTEASLVLADFTSAEMKSVNFSKSMLWGAIFRENRLAGVNLSGADITGVVFELSHLDGVDLRDVAWSGDFRIRDSLMSGVVFSGCSLAGAKFRQVNGVLISNFGHVPMTNLSGAVFEEGLPLVHGVVGASLDFSNVDLSNRSLQVMEQYSGQIDFTSSNLSGADFTNTRFARVDLTDACVVNAKPFGVYRKLLGVGYDDPRKEDKTVICRTRFSWGEESINCKPQN
tara:strand:- start:535 stop:5526 length:4992 start_codon:yes stop_codon:yes gene_type:complete